MPKKKLQELMNNNNHEKSAQELPPSVEEIKTTILKTVECIIVFCCESNCEKKNFFNLEKELSKRISALACLFFQLFLTSFHEQFDYSKWIEDGLCYKGKILPRTIKTVYGKVRYWRRYMIYKKGGGFYPFDVEIGLFRDGFTPWVMSLATKLATRISFSASVQLFKCFYGWSPSTEAIEALVLGMGKYAPIYMEQVGHFEDDGEILIIEVDGKATPTATDKELAKRRGKRKDKKKSCCQRHRSPKRIRGQKKRRKKGDKSKNGRSITLVAIYTLKKGDDGQLHGPINKKIWGSYAPRKVMLQWARNQATSRGFPPDTDKRVHIAIDGEKCLYDGLSKLFPDATFALDIRHLEEKIWKVGRTFYKEGTKELEEWVEDKREYLYTGRASELITELKKIVLSLSSRAKRDKAKRETLLGLIKYMEPRIEMMNYKDFIDEDMVIASGVIEGAARYVIGERMDCGGMRWIPERAEALLRLRCIELNGDWDHFFEWGYQHWMEKMKLGEKVIIRQEKPDELCEIPPLYIGDSDIGSNDEQQDAA